MKTLSSIKYSILFFLILTTAPLTSQSIKERAESLLSKMTLDEKIGQMTQVDYDAIKDNEDDVIKYSIGSILCGGDTEPEDISPKGWASLYDKFQKMALSTRLGIPIIWGIDAVHGHNNVDGAVIFPHNIGLGATRNPELVYKVAAVTAEEIKGTGMQWDFAPCVAVARDERWGRTYESFGEDPKLVGMLGAAYVRGMQGDNLSNKSSVLTCVKHFVGDGGTEYGKDQGNTICDEESLRSIHLTPYLDAIAAGAKSIMVSYSSWNNEKMHGNKYLITDVLKSELHFNGIVVSDWAAIDQLSEDYKCAIERSINAGLDMIMIPRGPGEKNNYIEFITYLKELVKEGKVKLERIDDAVVRILKVKFELGIFEKPFTDRILSSKIGSAENREVARESVRQSLVLLKNDKNILPINENVKRIHLAGRGADNIGMQCGGWTIKWKGEMEDVISGGTTILKGMENAFNDKIKITYSLDGSGVDGADVCIAVIGEEPYAEGSGDRKDLSLNRDDIALVQKLQSSNVPVVTILLSGRPMVINEVLEKSDAFIAAWLPGTEGGGIADVLVGKAKPVGKLSFSWPKNMDQIPINVGDKNYDPLFPYGFGLTY